MEQDEDLYLKANNEFNSKNRKESIWIKALTISRGNEEEAKYEYINLRVDSFKNRYLSRENPKEGTNFNNWYSKIMKSLHNNNSNEKQSYSINKLKPINKNINKTMNQTADENEPGKFRYIQAWLISAITSNILIAMITAKLVKNITSEAEFDAYYLYSPFIGGIIALSIWIAVINFEYYKNLKISKLILWISLLGGLGTILGLYKTQMSLKIVGIVVPPHFYTLTIVVFIAWVTAFYFYGVKKNRL
jgi:hypothetical protein